MKTTDQLAEYLMAQFAGTVQERALLTALDGRNRIKGLFWLRDGTSDRVSLEIKDAVAAASRAVPTVWCSAITTPTAWLCPHGRI